ncbi:hypothetical protein C8R43DRAFT_1007045 [Mycena crocata]|nr:hypothetical protein C8R43DRAFT_1007045 [Mycena crocata]
MMLVFSLILFLAATFTNAMAPPMRRGHPLTIPASGYCPLTDKANATLVTESTVGAFTTCTYTGAFKMCTYFATDGSFSSGSSDCPASIGGSAPPPPPPPSSGRCPYQDESFYPLTSEYSIGEFTTCNFRGPHMCVYFASTGGYSSGSSKNCPSSIYPFAPPAPPPPPSSASGQCPLTDKANGQLHNDYHFEGIVMCTYSNDTTLCAYAQTDGSWNSGTIDCPSSIAPMKFTSSPSSNSSVVAVAGAAAQNDNTATFGSSRLADNDNNSRNGTSGKFKGTFISQPILIALLAINGVLVIAILVIAGVWVFGRRGSRSSGPRNYKPVALSHSDDDRYYDPPK